MPLYLTGNTFAEDLAICQENTLNKEYHLAFTQIKIMQQILSQLPENQEQYQQLQALKQQESQLINAVDALSEKALADTEKQELAQCISWLLQEKRDNMEVMLIAIKAFYKLEKKQEADDLSDRLLEVTSEDWNEEREKYGLKIRYSLFLIQHKEKEAAEALELWLSLQPNLTPITVINDSLSERMTLIRLYLKLNKEERALNHLNLILEWHSYNKEALSLRYDILKKKEDPESLEQAAEDERTLRAFDEATHSTGHAHRIWQKVNYIENRKRKYVREEEEEESPSKVIRRCTN
ncbi:MAG: hypothetical protein CK426_08630 [Legionella sp.]|nr:MAG: hypothetical protein CK423_07465 [Legionella sp.]PJD97127.1 MAG: hypothetical protein CK426_08630 [Legionella sp.]